MCSKYVDLQKEIKLNLKAIREELICGMKAKKETNN